MTERHEPTEDIAYDAPIDEFAFEDEATIGVAEEEQTVETKLTQEILAYCDKAIGEHNSFDVLNIPQNATHEQKIAVFDEMFNHKGLVHHLRQIQAMIKTKVREN
jgi:hypothetical protein